MQHFLECEPDAEEKQHETDDEGIERDSGEVEMDELLMLKNSSYNKNSYYCSLKCIIQVKIFPTSINLFAYQKILEIFFFPKQKF